MLVRIKRIQHANPKDIEPHAGSRKRERDRGLCSIRNLSRVARALGNAHAAHSDVLIMFYANQIVTFECHSTRNLWFRSYSIPGDNNF
jgi:hypothetical protein